MSSSDDIMKSLKAAAKDGLFIGLVAGVCSMVGVDQMIGSTVGSTLASIVPPNMVGPVVVAGTFFGVVVIADMVQGLLFKS